MGFLDQIKTSSKTPSNGLKSSTSSSGGFLDKIVTSPQNSQPEATQPTKTPLGQGVSLSGPLGGMAQSTQAVPTASTPTIGPMKISVPSPKGDLITPKSVVKGVVNYEKDFLTGGADTIGGTVRNTILGLPKATPAVLQSMGQLSLRGSAAIASFLTAKPVTPEGQFQKDLYGTDKPISLESFGRETRLADPNQKSTGLMKKIDPAIGLVAGLVDAIPGGEEVRGLLGMTKNVRKIIAETDDVAKIAKLLKSEVPQMTEETASKFAQVFKFINNENDVNTAINRIGFEFNKVKPLNFSEDIHALPISMEQKNALQAVREGATTPDILKIVKTIDPKVFEAPVQAVTGGFLDQVQKNTATTPGNVPETKIPLNLETEAKKYKSAEEFVKAQGTPVYHGTTNESATAIEKGGFKIMDIQRGGRYTGDGVYFTPESSGASNFSGEKGKVLEAYLKTKNFKTVYLPEDNIDWQPGSDLVNEWKQKYDGVIIKSRDTDTKTGKVVDEWVNEIVSFKPEQIKTKSQLTDIWNKANSPAQPKAPVYEGETDLTTKILKDLEGKSTVSKQYILDATNRGELKQSERDITRQVLDTMPDGQINVKEFADKVKSELLPLKVKSSDMVKTNTKNPYEDFVQEGAFTPKYEGIALPKESRGKVANYRENIYESPIATSAGDTHFNYTTKNYFGHTRIEDMADNKTRRVIEVQSDLYQKGNLDKELENKLNSIEDGKKYYQYQGYTDEQALKTAKFVFENQGGNPKKLTQYNDPTAHFRMVREEIKKASQDGKTKLQFPTGETAMKIEGLGESGANRFVFGDKSGDFIYPENLKTGLEIMEDGAHDSKWIITDVLGDGKFKAVPKYQGPLFFENGKVYVENEGIASGKVQRVELDQGIRETFDISGKVDTNNPIYKFYEKEMQKYLNKFGAQKVTDSKGVTWYEIPISKSQSGAVEAFNKKRPLLTKDIYKTRDEIREILFKDIPKEDVRLIFTNELIQGVADGSFEVDKRLGNIIRLFEKDGKVSLTTALHESKHYIFSKLSPEVQKEALEIAKKEMGPLYKLQLEKLYKNEYKGPERTDLLLEEYVVDQWAKADATKGFGYKKSVFGKIFTALDNLLKRMVNTYNKVKARAEAIFKERGGSKGGYVNFGGEKPKKTPLGKSVGKVTIGGKEVDITKGGTMDIPVVKVKTPEIIKNIPVKTKELITQDLFNEYSQVEAKKELRDEKAVKDILTFKERQALIKNEIDMSKLEKENIESSISEEAKSLMKYKSKVTGELPEVTGKEKVSSPTTGKQIENSLFGRRGDQIVQGLGFKDLESAQNAFDTYLVQRARVNDIKKTISDKVKDYRDKKQIIEAVEAMLRKEGRERANQVSLIQDFFKLSDSEFKEITKRTPDFRLMTDERFQGLLKEVYNKSYDAFMLAEARMKLKATIFERELLKVDNLQQAEKLPKIENMSLSQLENFNTLLESFKQGDEFLGVRQLQTLKNTDLVGIKTKREVIDDLAKRTGKSIDQLKDISVNKFVDRMLYDTALARKNPFYEILVDDTNAALVNASLRFTDTSNKVDDLMKQARASRKRSIIDRLVPTDDLIFSYLEASPEEKLVMMKRMTKEEADAALYIQEKYAEARDYLVQREQLKTRYWDSYITHLPTGFLETWKGGIKDFNLKKAINDVLASFKEQEKIVNILDQKTGAVLPLEKFMRFTLTREGFSASHDVARAVTAYFRVFENKIALDQIIPKLDVYVHVLTPKKMTPRGLEFDDSLKTFWKEWMNNKKGRISAGIIKQGTVPMWMVKSGVAFTRILDLGFNIPVGIASHIGEQVGTFVNLGTKKYTLGLARYSTPTGREIAKKYQGFVGETLLQKLNSPTMGLKDKVTTTLFGLFSSADRKANIIHLLGSMSTEEFKAKTISVERLGKLKTEIGKYRVTAGDASIWQKTALGQVAYQYKKWAEPIMLTNTYNIKKVASMLKSGDKNVIHTTEFKELFRSVVVTSFAILISYGLYRELRDKKEKNFLENLAFKAMNDSLSMLSALNPNTYTSYRLLSFIKDITASLTLISSSLLMNDRTAKGTVPGLSALKSNITPKLIKQFAGKKKTIGEDLHDQFIKSKDKRGFLDNLLETDPDGADKLIAELQKEALGITDEEEKIKNMGVKNGQRAEAINKKLKKLKNSKERKDLLTDYIEKGILTEDVMVQLAELK